MTDVEAYELTSRLVGRGLPLASVRDRMVARLGPGSGDLVDVLIEINVNSRVAAAALTNSDKDTPLPLEQIPKAPADSPSDLIHYVLTVWHNPGEYIYVQTDYGKSVSLRDLEVLAQAALAYWAASNGYGTPVGYLQPYGQITAFRGGKADVPKGFFRVRVERIERLTGIEAPPIR